MGDAPQDVILTLDHPHGSLEVTLEEWIQRGPGPRPNLRPVAARSRDGSKLPLSVIPMRYRNSAISRALIRMGLLERPWQ